jgi:MFS family permease
VTLGSVGTTVRSVLRGGPELGEVDATIVTRAGSGSWVKIAFAMFAVGWGANQFSPMLIVYRHELRLSAGVVAGLFLVYALTLIPGLLVGGPASDRFGRRPVVLPFVVLSPLATLLLVLGPRSLALICAGRALAGLCSGVVFGSATAWVQELSHGAGQSARRATLALTAGFGLGPRRSGRSIAGLGPAAAWPAARGRRTAARRGGARSGRRRVPR